jgi:hypothetical protein
MGSPTGAGVIASVGPATLSWNLTPTFPAPMCEVPVLAHDTLTAAEVALRDAGCRLGTVTRRPSARQRDLQRDR